jgi:DNA polymerase-3 subunit beta
MKFTISSGNLQKHLNLAGGAITANPVVPILENFLFKIEGSLLTLSATDLETSIVTSTEVQADGDFAVAIPAKLITDTLKQLPEQPITIDVDEQYGIQITSSYGKYKLAGADPADYPKLPQAEDVEKISASVSTLERAINKTLFATTTDELRPAMMGVFFEVEGSEINFVATDAHKLVKFTASELTGSASGTFIVPRKALTLLKNAIHGSDEVMMAFNKKNAFFDIGTTHIACLLINANFPDYNNVIPRENPKTLSVDRGDLQSSLKRIALYANKTTNQVQLDLNEGSLTLQGRDADFNNEATEQLTCSYDGEPLKIAFNAKFLVEMLNAIDSETITMKFSEPNRAAIMLPGEEEEHEETLMLVMPVMVHY